MASIQTKDNSPYWYAAYRDATGRSCNKSTKIVRQPEDLTLTIPNHDTALRMALEWERQERAGLAAGAAALPAPSPLVGIPSYREQMRSWIAGLGGDPSYRGKCSGYADRIDEFLGAKSDLPVCQLHSPEFAGLVSWIREKGYSTTTASAHLKLIRQAYLDAQQKGFVLVCPISPKDYVANPSPNRPKPVTSPQIEHLLNRTRIIDWRTTILFGFYAAMDLLEAVGQGWDNVSFEHRTVSWINHTRDGKPATMTMPLHPLLAKHLIAVKRITASEFVTPSLRDLSDCALRCQFRHLMDDAELRAGSVTSRLDKHYRDLQFSSLKLAFGELVGHPGLFRLTRFLRGLEAQELEKQVARIPHLNLGMIPLLGAY